jgi:hypothetical protein
MNKPRLLGTCAAFAAALLVLPVVVSLPVVPVAHAQDALRPAVGKPLEKAKAYLAQKNYSAAQEQIAIADRQKNKSANEDFVIQEMRGAVAQASGDTATASKVFADIINSGRLSGGELTKMLLAQTSLSYQMKDYPGVISWAQRYHKAGGKDPVVGTLIIQAYYLQKDYTRAAEAQKQQIDAEIAAHKMPTESQLQLLAACQKQLTDTAALEQTLTQLVTYYPKPSYWADLVYRLQTSPGFSDRLELDLDRLKVRLGLLTTENAYMEMIQLALVDNNPGGALRAIASAQKDGLFGQPGKAEREQRLIALANKTAGQTKASLDQNDKDLTASPSTTAEQLFDLGQNYASFGDYQKGTNLMQQAIAKGGLSRPAQAQLRLGEALINAGQKGAAMEALQKVPETTDGTSGLAKMWLLWLRTQSTLTQTPA